MGCAMSSDIDRLERALEHQNDQLLLMAQGGMCNEQNEALLEEIRDMLADRRAEPGTLSQSQVASIVSDVTSALRVLLHQEYVSRSQEAADLLAEIRSASAPAVKASENTMSQPVARADLRDLKLRIVRERAARKATPTHGQTRPPV